MLTDERDIVKTYFQSFSILTDSDIEGFTRHLTKRKLKKSEFLIQIGQVCTEVVFVQKGTLRSFYVSNKGEEITYCITFPNNFTTSYSSFITSEGSSVNIQCITPVELMTIPKNKIDELLSTNPNWVTFLKIIAEQQYLELERRMFQLQKGNALHRYSELAKRQRTLIQSIPLQYLASYLGITSRHLSRIRKSK